MNRKQKAWLNFLMVFLFCGALFLLVLGTSLARYQENKSKELLFHYEAKSEQIYITKIDDTDAASEGDSMEVVSEGESTEAGGEEENTYVVNFLLANGAEENSYCTYDQIASLSLFATIGVGNPEEFTITLTDGGNTYAAVYSEVVEGTTMYSLYGPGWIYRFYNEAGEELSWFFPGTQYVSRQMTLTVEGACELPTALSLIANAKPGGI
ncbi:MAG: hypothetical protein J6C37_00065 [Roseburia sp.]|nr:hypothetical protein [Roseburia sp.]